MSMKPEILSESELSTAEAKWIGLKVINWKDEDGKERRWECAERKTRAESGIDAVAILAILRSRAGSFPPSTVIIEQYRPPIGKYLIELPAGLVDAGETAEETAIRELEEETGFRADEDGGIIESTPLLANDPGMTNANMKLVTVSVTFPDQLELSDAKLEEQEHIVKRVVALGDLYQTLKDYDEKGFVVDARLSHLALGYKLASQY